MINLSARSYQKELLDNDHIPFADIQQNMKELNMVNTYLGGHGITISGIKKFMHHHAPGIPISICEIGCGGGDNLHTIRQWCNKKNIPALFTGIDIKPECIDFARQQYPKMNAEWITSDYQLVNFSKKPDIIFSSLFCHHFTEDEIISMLLWMKNNSAKGFFINDLQRHPLAYYAIKLITKIFSRSYLVKNDAPLSVARGFTKKEWRRIFEHAAIKNYSIKWRWAFRHIITCDNGSTKKI
jgi:2-polyprenyl-3-methyl-5-hydroxy-6-metoxy-1,4-benzoquinol methylase